MSKKNKIENQFTLDAKHKELITTFKTEFNNLPYKKEKVTKLQKKLIELQSKSDVDYSEIYDIENEIDELNEQIIKLEQNSLEQDYYLRTNNILYNYYSFNNRIENEHNTDNIPQQTTAIKQQTSISEPTSKKTTSLDKFFKKNTNEQNNTPSEDIASDIQSNELENSTTETKKKTKISHFYQVDAKFNKSDILTQYLSIVEPSSVPYMNNQNNNKCYECGEPLEININEGNMECNSCGTMIDYFYTNDKPTYKDNVPEVNYFSYKPLNHYNECKGYKPLIFSMNVLELVF
jgi:hypothetical protein